MRLALICHVLLVAGQLLAQNPDWFPVGAKITYADIPWGPGDEYPVEFTVLEAFYEDSADVRIIDSPYRCYCSELPASDPFRIHRRGDRVYYADTTVGEEWLLYDFGAMPGDTLKVLMSYSGSPPKAEFTNVVMGEVYEQQYCDTTLLVQETFWDVDYGYSHVLLGIGSLSYFFTEFGACDPVCGGMVSYEDPNVGKLCIQLERCHQWDLDHPYSPFQSNLHYYFGDSTKYRGYYGLDLTFDCDTSSTWISLVSDDAMITGEDNCIKNDIGGWAFGKARVLSGRAIEFYNYRDEPILIRLDVPDGEWWEAYSGDGVVRARVASTEIVDIDGELDSVKHFEFDYMSGASEIENLQFSLTREHGVWQMISFMDFPAYDNWYFPYERADMPRFGVERPGGVWGEASGALNLNWFAAFNLEMGDELHVERGIWYGEDEDDSSLWQEKLVFLGRESSGNTFYVQWARERKEFASMLDSSFIIIRDTMVQEYDFVDVYGTGGFRQLPGVALTMDVDSTEFGRYSYGGQFNGRSTKTIWPWIYQIEYPDSCWTMLDEEEKHVETFIDGLAGPYWDEPLIINGYSSDWRRLKYYRKVDGEEWGKPFDFTVSIALPDPVGQMELYPSPAGDQITVSTSHGRIVELRLFNSAGQVMLLHRCIDNEPVDISSIPSGMYFYQINDNDRFKSGKLVVLR